MTLEDFMKAIQYRITGGDPYCWDAFGTKARWLNCDDIETYSASVVYDSDNQTIYSAEAHDYKLERAYRWINPDYRTVYKEESQRRNVDHKKAWDAVNFTDLETEEDFLSKCSAIIKGESYDDRVTVPIELDDDEIFELMKMAHKKDITLNQLVESILTEMIQKHNVAV